MRGEVIRELREKHGYSRKELADKLYISASELQSWEEGWFIKGPSSGEIEEMADAFKMTEDSLRELINHSECDDADKNEEPRFIDYVDSAVRLGRFLKR